MRLITIAFSHYNEFARWALDRSGVAYREEGYMPLLHFAPVALAVRGAGDAQADAQSTRFSTPVLVCDDGRRICDSRRIARHVDEQYRGSGPGLYQLDEAAGLEERFHKALGPHTRRLAYFHLLPRPDLVRRIAQENVGPLQNALFRALRPLGTPLLRRSLRVTRPAAERSVERIRHEFDVADELLAKRPYLAGEQFSAADMSFASMAAPALWIQRDEGYGAWLPSLAQLPAPGAELARELRASRAGQHVLRMFRDERRRARAAPRAAGDASVATT
jgi:glutathione S-transferase